MDNTYTEQTQNVRWFWPHGVCDMFDSFYAYLSGNEAARIHSLHFARDMLPWNIVFLCPIRQQTCWSYFAVRCNMSTQMIPERGHDEIARAQWHKVWWFPQKARGCNSVECRVRPRIVAIFVPREIVGDPNTQPPNLNHLTLVLLFGMSISHGDGACHFIMKEIVCSARSFFDILLVNKNVIRQRRACKLNGFVFGVCCEWRMTGLKTTIASCQRNQTRAHTKTSVCCWNELWKHLFDTASALIRIRDVTYSICFITNMRFKTLISQTNWNKKQSVFETHLLVNLQSWLEFCLLVLFI